MKPNLLKHESLKYDLLHNIEAYGFSTGRKAWFSKSSTVPFIKKTMSILSNSNRILDVCCGKGSFIDHFNETLNLKIDGIDISKVAVDSRKDLNLVLGSADDLPYSDKSYDCLYHFDGMEHIPIEIEDKVLDEQFRVSSKYIIHCLSIKNDDIHDKYLKTRHEDISMTPVHINIKPSGDWLNIFNQKANQHGWKIIEFDDTAFSHHVSVILEKVGE
jgi:ubiquinone/menaquinone biosynthesis C-methylase UbiE